MSVGSEPSLLPVKMWRVIMLYPLDTPAILINRTATCGHAADTAI